MNILDIDFYKLIAQCFRKLFVISIDKCRPFLLKKLTDYDLFILFNPHIIGVFIIFYFLILMVKLKKL